jgi:GTP-binding protein
MNSSIVAIIGRQNVGKSTLLNRLAGKRLAITEDLPGTTRDRIFTRISSKGRSFTLVDTGGLEMKPESAITEGINQQILSAIDEADLIIFLTDIKDGATPVDYEIADILRMKGKPLILAANKADNAGLEIQAADLFNIGLGQPMAISAYHGRGINELLDKITSLLPEEEPVPQEEPSIKVAIIGRANVGKSTLLNTLLGEERAIVNHKPGTTRDALDTILKFNDYDVLLIDTAGIRRRGRIESGVERHSVIRSLKAIDRADIVLLLIDASEGVTSQDTHIAGYARQAAKGIIILVNKCDLIGGLNRTEFNDIIKSRLKFVPFAPIIYISAKLGRGVKEILPKVVNTFKQRFKRVTTAEVNNMLKEVTAAHEPPRSGTKKLKFLYGTQAEVNPPTFIFFVNDAKLVHFSYRRYLENRLRKSFGFDSTPVKMSFRSRAE